MCKFVGRTLQERPTNQTWYEGIKILIKGVEELINHPWFQGINWQAVQSKKYKAPFVPVLKSEHDTTYFSAAITSSSLESITSYSGMPGRQES